MADTSTEVHGLLLSNDEAPDWGADGILIGHREEPAAPVVTEEEEEQVTADDDDTEIEYVPDPGDYVPQDYSFEITTFDDKNEHPQSHKIISVEEWEKLMESDPNFGSVAALDKAMRLSRKMETNSEQDLKEYNRKKADFDAVRDADTAQTQQMDTWTKEMAYLVTKGDMPKVAKEYQDADWTNPEIAKQDGVKEQVELLKFMDKENKLRTKAGLRPLTSVIDAFNAYTLDSSKQRPSDTKRTEADARKAAGSRVAAASSNPVGSAPKGIAVGRGGSLDDLSSSWF